MRDENSVLAEINYPATFTVHITLITVIEITLIFPYYGSKLIIILVICGKIRVFLSIIRVIRG